MNALLIQIAASQIGVKEIEGSEHNQTIVNYSKEIGLFWIDDDETPWCAIAINWTLKKGGYPYKASARARDFESYGTLTTNPEPGDIVVFWRGSSKDSGLGHVGFFLGFNFDKTKVFCLGGNQGNQWTVSAYPIDKVVCYRRVGVSANSLEIPNVSLMYGERNVEVSKLQSILKYLGVNPKLQVDNDFGANTLIAMKAFQKKYGLPVTGQYTISDKNKLFELLNA